MSSVLSSRNPLLQADDRWLKWLPVLFGVLAMYAPMYYSMAGTIWQSEEYAHGPIVLAVCLWLFWKERSALVDTAGRAAPLVGGVLIAAGLALYVVGTIVHITLFQVGSQIPLFAGVILAFGGWPALRRLWVALLFLVFVVPLPGFLLDTLTGSLKQQVSVIVEHLLYSFGYPIARQGVILTIGPYQMEVANACSGLNSMYSLTAIGILYLYLMRHQSLLRNAVLVVALWPIAFVANIIRVITLVLVTYYFGDEAGQGFFHGFAGIMLFALALGMLFGLDAALGLRFKDRPRVPARA
jgi:exosortase B